MGSRSGEVDAYMAALSEERRAQLERLREIIHETVAHVTESMEYRLPTFSTSAKLCAIGAQKHYMCLYICNDEVMEKHRPELAGMNLGKGCIRFKSLDQCPLPVFREILVDMAARPGFDKC